MQITSRCLLVNCPSLNPRVLVFVSNLGYQFLTDDVIRDMRSKKTMVNIHL